MNITVTQLKVMNQNEGSYGNETCGYHSYKNALLGLLFNQGLISEEKYNELLTSKELFEAIFSEAKKIIKGQGNDCDLASPYFLEILQKTKNGDYDFTQQGLPKTILQSINLNNISVADICVFPNAPEYGLGGELNNLLCAAYAAKLARTQGEAQHVFAIAINYGRYPHWVNLNLVQDAQGNRSWSFMDSYNNQSLYKRTIVHKIETILQQKPADLRSYLLEVYKPHYESIVEPKYKHYFDKQTGSPIPGVTLDMFDNGAVIHNAREHYIQDEVKKDVYINYIQTSFKFMQMVGWLTSHNSEEYANIKQLHFLAKYLLENLNPTDISSREKLEIICNELKTSVDIIPNDTETLSSIDEDSVDKQANATMEAIEDKEPHPLDRIISKFVNAIKYLIEGINIALDNLIKFIIVRVQS